MGALLEQITEWLKGMLVAAIPNILKSGILSNAAGFLLLHNHPSGDVTPSKEDITTTRRCVEAGKLMDIPCLDHVIVGGSNGDIFSFRESGIVDFTSDKISMTAEQILHVNESNSSYKGGIETMPENGIVDSANTIAIECKRYTWTETGNVPSAKMGFTNEAAFYLSFLPNSFDKYIVMLYSSHEKRQETLAEYYYRTYRHLLGNIKIAEYDPEKKQMRILGESHPEK